MRRGGWGIGFPRQKHTNSYFGGKWAWEAGPAGLAYGGGAGLVPWLSVTWSKRLPTLKA